MEFFYLSSELEIQGKGVGFAQWPMILALLLSSIIYTIFYSYLVHVVPGNLGSPKSLLFFLDLDFWRSTPPSWNKAVNISGSKENNNEKTLLISNQNQINQKNISTSFVSNSTSVLLDNQSSLNNFGGLMADQIRINNLYKSYNAPAIPFLNNIKEKLNCNNQIEEIIELDEIVAVNNLGLTINSGEIFALLGQNGAGKSTTIGILTGMIVPTAGSVSVLGLDLSKDLDKIRRNIGICQQEDILWEQLTVKEHLQIFGALKGTHRHHFFERLLDSVGLMGHRLTADEIETQMNWLLKRVGLVDNNDTLVPNLSGGMKRKLCIAIAFLGNPSLVFLDECTAGVDPYSRNMLCEFLEEIKENRIIIMTTHHIEEADILGDRIGIMDHGSLKCLGTPFELKSQFGVGNKLVLVLDQTRGDLNIKVEKFMNDFWGKEVENINLLTSSRLEMSYQIPQSLRSSFPQFLSLLDNESVVLGVTSYGIQTTTLEDVFLKITKLNNESDLTI